MSGTDFNGDGYDDILWLFLRDVAVTNWLGTSDGGFLINDQYAYNQLNVMHHFQFIETGDFNGDGRSDLLWLVDGSQGGNYSIWYSDANGGSSIGGPGTWFEISDPTLRVADVADFNGDGRDDILWRNAAGAISQWLSVDNGGFAYNPNAAYQLPTNWALATSSDFNGDGRDDILWRNEAGAMSQWLSEANGAFVWNAKAGYQLSANWQLAGTGDFNGDGRDDILWRNEIGAMSEWLANGDGTFAWNPNAAYQLPTNWELATTGDFNGDGRDDILWRNEVGAIAQWLANHDGTFAYNPNAAYQLPTSWQVQSEYMV